MMAYYSDESGKIEVYVQPFLPSGEKWKVSANGGQQPRWRSDGKEIYYLAANGDLMAVEVERNSEEAVVGDSRVLFKTAARPLDGKAPSFSYVPDTDGQRFLVNLPVGESKPPPITIVLNWQDQLEN